MSEQIFAFTKTPKNKALRRQAIFVWRKKNFVFSLRDHSGYTNLISEIFDSDKLSGFWLKEKCLCGKGLTFQRKYGGAAGIGDSRFSLNFYSR